MRIVTKAELLTLPKGTIFREWEPCVFHGEWMRFHGPCGDNDFIYSNIGADFEPAGCDPSRDYFAMIISSDNTGRDGQYVKDARYIVLDEKDVEAIINQLRGIDFPEIVMKIPDDQF